MHPRMINGPPRVKRSHTLVALPARGRRREAVAARDRDIAEREGRGVPRMATGTCMDAEWVSLRWCTLPHRPSPATSREEEREVPE